MATIQEAFAEAVRLHQAGRLQEAEQIYRQILEFDHAQPQGWDLAQVHANLGVALLGQEKTDEAIASFGQALELSPGSAEALNGLATAYQARGELDEAASCYRRALECRPDFAEAHNNLGNVLKDQARWQEAIGCYLQALTLQPNIVQAHSSLVYALWYCPGFDVAAIYKEHCRWNERWGLPLAGLVQPHGNDRSPNRRLRVGYVSPDFRKHVQMLFMAPLLAAHDHTNFEVFCYANVAVPDEVTRRLKSSADVWRDTAVASDEAVAQRIRDDRIDVLVDLTMHMAGGRPLVFARGPAPVQVCWLAYPGTTGLTAIDYRLTDPQLDPPELFDRFYSESSIRLPETFWCYDPLTSEPTVGPLPAGTNGHVTFGCLNNFCKVNDDVLRLWARVLKTVERSRLLLLVPRGSARERTLDVLEQEGISRDRVTLTDFRPRLDYLTQYHQIDIGLDTFPYNGHTTSLDSYWMGVPVVTLVGNTVVGRAGLSQLTNLGLTELVAQTPQRFVEIAVGLAGDWERLKTLRSSLRERMQKSPLMDAPRFALNIEAAYREMWRRWCASLRP